MTYVWFSPEYFSLFFLHWQKAIEILSAPLNESDSILNKLRIFIFFFLICFNIYSSMWHVCGNAHVWWAEHLCMEEKGYPSLSQISCFITLQIISLRQPLTEIGAHSPVNRQATPCNTGVTGMYLATQLFMQVLGFILVQQSLFPIELFPFFPILFHILF